MTWFRKKPVVIDAYQFHNRVGPDDRPIWIHEAARDGIVKFHQPVAAPAYLIISTLEGEMRAEVDDWIIRGVKGELYPCKPDIFAATYEDADAATAPSAPADQPSPDKQGQQGERSDFKRFFAWALDAGYDVAHAYDTERSRWVFHSPMTADLWDCWQFARLPDGDAASPAPTEEPRTDGGEEVRRAEAELAEMRAHGDADDATEAAAHLERVKHGC